MTGHWEQWQHRNLFSSGYFLMASHKNYWSISASGRGNQMWIPYSMWLKQHIDDHVHQMETGDLIVLYFADPGNAKTAAYGTYYSLWRVGTVFVNTSWNYKTILIYDWRTHCFGPYVGEIQENFLKELQTVATAALSPFTKARLT